MVHPKNGFNGLILNWCIGGALVAAGTLQSWTACWLNFFLFFFPGLEWEQGTGMNPKLKPELATVLWLELDLELELAPKPGLHRFQFLKEISLKLFF